MRSLLVVLFVAVAFFATGEAIKCYECASPLSKACKDPFDKDGSGVRAVECPLDNMSCLKSVSELSNKTTVTARSCWFSTAVRSAERASDVTFVSSNTQFCNEDLCNGVSATGVTLSALIVLVVPFVFAQYH